MLHEEHESPCLDCPAPSPCSHLMGMCPLLSSSHPPLPTEDWKLPISHLSDPLACASPHWYGWAPGLPGQWPGTTGTNPEPQGAEREPEVCLLRILTLWSFTEAAQWWVAGINVFLLFPLFVCPSLSTTSHGESWRLHLPPAALRALQPRDGGGVLLWPWLHPHQRLQVHHLPVRRVVPLLPSVLCQNR